MSYRGVITAKTSKAKCIQCREPIIKKEGIMRYAHGYYCYKCSKRFINQWIFDYKVRLKQLEKSNHIGERRMNELKIAKML